MHIGKHLKMIFISMSQITYLKCGITLSRCIFHSVLYYGNITVFSHICEPALSFLSTNDVELFYKVLMYSPSIFSFCFRLLEFCHLCQIGSNTHSFIYCPVFWLSTVPNETRLKFHILENYIRSVVSSGWTWVWSWKLWKLVYQ